MDVFALRDQVIGDCRFMPLRLIAGADDTGPALREVELDLPPLRQARRQRCVAA
ncbi:MAG: hypothetical protein V3T72_05605 [Thermoanaerobaculia bacterium]